MENYFAKSSKIHGTAVIAGQSYTTSTCVGAANCALLCLASGMFSSWVHLLP